MNLETQKTIVPKSAKDLFALLEKVETFERLMPDNISKFEKLANGKIPFQLTTNIAEISDKESEVQLLFKGDFNPIMAMMVKTPISKFIEVLVTKMKDL